jgi:catechol-2,3-dioxygenase
LPVDAAAPSGARRQKRMLKTEGVGHFTIPVKNLDRAERFYTEVMGMERLTRNDHMVFMRTNQDCFVG